MEGTSSAPDSSVAPPEDRASDATAVPATEPARGSGSDLNTIEDAFRGSPDALKGQGPTRRTEDRSSGEAPPGASATPAGSLARDPAGPASKPGEDLSRRGAAGRISEQQQEIDRLVAEREQERARAAEAEARVWGHQQQREAAQKAALAKVGDDRDFATLSTRRMRGEVLSYEDDEKLNGMLAWREHAADLWEIADRAHKADIASRVGSRVEKYSLDKRVAYEAPLPELLDHVYATAEAKVRAETQNELAELRAENRGLRTRAGKAQAPAVGGASAPGGVPMPVDGASSEDWFRYAFEQQQASGAGNRSPGRR